jgi:hypothetical protein
MSLEPKERVVDLGLGIVEKSINANGWIVLGGLLALMFSEVIYSMLLRS